MENETLLPNDANPRESDKLRWYQYRLSSILWLTLIMALFITSIVMWNRLSNAELRIEELQRLGITEPMPGYITRINLGPSWLFRGDLPEGNWRLAVYVWEDEKEPIYNDGDLEPPRYLAPLISQSIPSKRIFDIAIIEASLPADAMSNGKSVKTVYNFQIIDPRLGRISTLTPIYSPKDTCGDKRGCPPTSPTFRPKGFYLWLKRSNKPEIHYILARLELVDEKSLPPQTGL